MGSGEPGNSAQAGRFLMGSARASILFAFEVIDYVLLFDVSGFAIAGSTSTSLIKLRPPFQHRQTAGEWGDLLRRLRKHLFGGR